MKRRLLIVLLVGLGAGIVLGDEAEVKSLMKAVLGKEIIAEDPAQQINYWAEFGETNLIDGSRVEYASIQNGDEIEKRSSSLATAYRDGVMVTNVTPLEDFCFGMRKTDPTGGVRVVRVDYLPRCWEGRAQRGLALVRVGDDPQVSVNYTCVVISNGLSRTLNVQDVFSLSRMERVSRREISELRYDFDQSEIRAFENGVCTATQVMKEVGGSIQVVANGFVKDETGAPVSGQKVRLDWDLFISNWTTLVNTQKAYSNEVTTDANGYFEYGIKESSGCHISIERPGYIKLRFYREQSAKSPQLPPLDIRLTRIPAGATNIGTEVSWMVKKDEIEIYSLLNCRSVGLSLDTYKKEGRTYVAGWTTNKAQADVWFELGGTDEAFLAHFDRCLATNVALSDWQEWPLTITGLRGTQVKEAPTRPSPGMDLDMRWTLCEADAAGYSDELTGFAWDEAADRWKWGTKHVLSPNLYICKDQRYGRLVGCEVGPHPQEGDWNAVTGKRPITNMTLRARFNDLNVQTTNLGHRALQRL